MFSMLRMVFGLGEESEELDLNEFPEVLKEFDEIKEKMEEEDLSAENAFSLLKDRKGDSAFDDFSQEAIEAFMGILREDLQDEEG